MEDLRPLSYIIISLLYILAMITIVMRIWVRGYSMKSFGWDDWAMASLLVRTNLHSYLRLATDIIRFHNLRSSFLSNKLSCIFLSNLVPGCKWHRLIFPLRLEKLLWFQWDVGRDAKHITWQAYHTSHARSSRVDDDTSQGRYFFVRQNMSCYINSVITSRACCLKNIGTSSCNLLSRCAFFYSSFGYLKRSYFCNFFGP